MSCLISIIRGLMLSICWRSIRLGFWGNDFYWVSILLVSYHHLGQGEADFIFLRVSSTNFLIIRLCPISTHSISGSTRATDCQNITGWVRCRANPSLISASAWYSSVSRLRRMRALGVEKWSFVSQAVQGTNMGVSRLQWKAVDTGRGRQVILACLKLVRAAQSLANGPDTLTLFGVLQQAISKPACLTIPQTSPQRPSANLTITIPHGSPVHSSIILPLACTNFNTSPSSIQPARQSAEYQPILCPSIQSSGQSLQGDRYLKWRTWDSTSKGWTTLVRDRRELGSVWVIQGKFRERLVECWVISLWAYGWDSRVSSMPFYWVPWPANTNSLGLDWPNPNTPLARQQPLIIIKQARFKKQPMRKTSNLLIRQGSKKSSRENPQTLTNTSFKSRQSKDTKRAPSTHDMELQKQMIRAENLNEREQEEIQSEARRTVTKRIKMMENRIQGEIVDMLERECAKVGAQLEREKVDNQKLRVEIDKLRKNIETLNEKLQKMYNDKTHLSKNQIDGKIQNKVLAEEAQNLRSLLKTRQSQIEYLKTQKESIVGSMKSQVIELKQTIEKLTINNKNLREEKDEIEEELEERTKEAQYLRESFESKKRQWETEKREFESNVKSHLQKKGEKITKFQVDSQKLQQKLKQQQTMRKKLTEKNKDLEKQLAQQVEARKQLQEQITSYKKRVNDLSILKSSNNAIMNQKIAKIVEENEKLKMQIEELRTGVKPEKLVQKPMLFGADDFD